MAAYEFSGRNLEVDTFTGDLSNEGGSLLVAENTSVNGDYAQLTNAVMEIRLMGGTGNPHGSLSVVSNAALNGTLRLEWTDSSGWPRTSAGDTYDILIAETITGSFEQLDLPYLPTGLTMELALLPDEIGVAVKRRINRDRASIESNCR